MSPLTHTTQDLFLSRFFYVASLQAAKQHFSWLVVEGSCNSGLPPQLAQKRRDSGVPLGAQVGLALMIVDGEMSLRFKPLNSKNTYHGVSRNRRDH
jgi:hypothetical protein